MEAAFLPPRILGDSRRFLVKFSIDSLLNGRELPPQKKRVLAIGGIAFIVLLFASFLLSLSEDESTPSNDVANAVAQPELNTNLTPNIGPNNQTQVQGQGQGQTGTLQLPSSQRYDFNQGQSQQGQGLESLLNDNMALLIFQLQRTPKHRLKPKPKPKLIIKQYQTTLCTATVLAAPNRPRAKRQYWPSKVL